MMLKFGSYLLMVFISLAGTGLMCSRGRYQEAGPSGIRDCLMHKNDCVHLQGRLNNSC